MTNPNDKELGALREKAELVKRKLVAAPRERALFVEFSGSPKSGKSTCIDIVAHFLRRLGFSTLAPTEGASKRTPYYLKRDLVAFNVWSATYALTHILEGLSSSDGYQIAILDRGLFDALVWFDILEKDGKITQGEKDKIQAFLTIDHWRDVVDGVFLFHADPDTSMERENRDKLVSEPGTAMNPDFLMRLNDGYARVKDQFSGSFRNVKQIDTSGAASTTPQSTAYEVTNSILDLLNEP